MDEERFRRMRQKVQAELVGCVKLSSLPLSKKVSKEIVEDRIRLFEFFRSQGLEKQVELNETLLRLLMNYVKMASYHGVLKGFKIEEQAAKLRKDKARYHLAVFLQKQPNATYSNSSAIWIRRMRDSQKAKQHLMISCGPHFRRHGGAPSRRKGSDYTTVNIGRSR